MAATARWKLSRKWMNQFLQSKLWHSDKFEFDDDGINDDNLTNRIYELCIDSSDVMCCLQWSSMWWKQTMSTTYTTADTCIIHCTPLCQDCYHPHMEQFVKKSFQCHHLFNPPDTMICVLLGLMSTRTITTLTTPAFVVFWGREANGHYHRHGQRGMREMKSCLPNNLHLMSFFLLLLHLLFAFVNMSSAIIRGQSALMFALLALGVHSMATLFCWHILAWAWVDEAKRVWGVAVLYRQHHQP